MRFLRKNCGPKLGEFDTGNGTERTRRDKTERTDAQRLAALRWPRFPFGDLILFFPPCFSSPSLLRSFPMTGSSCSARPVSFPNVFQRQPLLCPWPFKTIYSVKIAGPENVTATRREKTVRNHSFPEHSPENTLSALRQRSLSAWRRFAPTVPVFGDLGKRLNPRYLPVLENTCPQPISVEERLSPRLHSPLVKNMKRFRPHTPVK